MVVAVVGKPLAVMYIQRSPGSEGPHPSVGLKDHWWDLSGPRSRKTNTLVSISLFIIDPRSSIVE